MTSHNEKRPGRPFGVTLAILVSVLIYTIFPLLAVGSVLIVERHFENASDNANPFGDQIVSGGDFRGGVTDTQLIIQSAIAIGFMFIAILAWRTRRTAVRYGFMAAVLALAIFAIVTTTLPTEEATNTTISGGSMDSVSDFLEIVSVIAQGMLVPLYVIWYMNRGPARAFYRGYYLSETEKGVYAAGDPQPQTPVEVSS